MQSLFDTFILYPLDYGCTISCNAYIDQSIEYFTQYNQIPNLGNKKLHENIAYISIFRKYFSNPGQ